MSISVDEINHETSGKHVYVVGRLPYENGWLTYLAQKYIEMRSQVEEMLTGISFDGLAGFDIAKLQARIKEATIPYEETNDKRKNFSIIRSDLGEALNYVLLEQRYGTRFAVNLVADRELTSLPGRGIDAIGIENEDDDEVIRIIFSEVKVSGDKNSPPGVVEASSDSMHEQHCKHVKNHKITADKIFEAAKKAKSSELRTLFLTAAMLFDESATNIEVVAHCFLVRPDEYYSPKDFGKFKKKPDTYKPARVRFEIICVPDMIDIVETKWYDEIVKVGGLNRE